MTWRGVRIRVGSVTVYTAHLHTKPHHQVEVEVSGYNETKRAGAVIDRYRYVRTRRNERDRYVTTRTAQQHNAGDHNVDQYVTRDVAAGGRCVNAPARNPPLSLTPIITRRSDLKR